MITDEVFEFRIDNGHTLIVPLRTFPGTGVNTYQGYKRMKTLLDTAELQAKATNHPRDRDSVLVYANNFAIGYIPNTTAIADKKTEIADVLRAGGVVSVKVMSRRDAIARLAEKAVSGDTTIALMSQEERSIMEDQLRL